jgi:flagellar motor switch protein FliG
MAALLSGTQKAAMLLMQLGRERAAKVMQELDTTAWTSRWRTRSSRSSTTPR